MQKKGQNSAELILILSAVLIVALVGYFIFFEFLEPSGDIKIAESHAYWTGISYGIQLSDWKMEVYADGSVPATEANLSVIVKNPLSTSITLRQIQIAQGDFGHVWFLEDRSFAGLSDNLSILLNPGDSVELVVQHYQNGEGRYTPPEVYALDTTIIYDSPQLGTVSQTGNFPVVGKRNTFNASADLDATCPGGTAECPAGSGDCCPSANCVDGVCKTNLCAGVTCDVPGCEICDRATGDCYCTDATTPSEYYCSGGVSCVLREVRNCSDGLAGYDSATMTCTDNCASGYYCNSSCSCVAKTPKACADSGSYDSATMYCSDTDCTSVPGSACDVSVCSCVSCPSDRLCGSICCSDGEVCEDPATETCVSACQSYEYKCESADGTSTACCTKDPQQYCATSDATCCDTPVCDYTDNGQPLSECCDLTYQGCDAQVGCCQNTPDAYCNEAEGIYCCDGYICNQNKCYCNGDCCQNLLNGYCNTTLPCCSDQIPSLHCVIPDGQTEGTCDDNCPDGYTTLADGSCCADTKICSEGGSTWCCGFSDSRYYSLYGAPPTNACLCCAEGSEPCGNGDARPVCCPTGQCSVDGVCCDTSNPNIEVCSTGPDEVACCDASVGLSCVDSSSYGASGTYDKCCNSSTTDVCDFYGTMQCCDGTCFTNSDVFGNAVYENCCPDTKDTAFCDDGKCCDHSCNPQDDGVGFDKCCAVSSDVVCDDGTCCSDCFDKAGTTTSQCCDDTPGTTEVCADGTCCTSAGGCASKGLDADARCCSNGATSICTGDDLCCVDGCDASSGSSGLSFCCDAGQYVCDSGCCSEACLSDGQGGNLCCEGATAIPQTASVCGGECCPIGDCYNENTGAEVCCPTGQEGDDIGTCCPASQIQERPTDGAMVCCDGTFDSYGTCCDTTTDILKSRGGKTICCDSTEYAACYASDASNDLTCCLGGCYTGPPEHPTCCDTGESVCQTSTPGCCPDGQCFDDPVSEFQLCCDTAPQTDFCYSNTIGAYTCCANCLTYPSTGDEICCSAETTDLFCSATTFGTSCGPDCCESGTGITLQAGVNYFADAQSIDNLCCNDSLVEPPGATPTSVCLNSADEYVCCGSTYSCVTKDPIFDSSDYECCPANNVLCGDSCCDNTVNSCTTIDEQCCPDAQISELYDTAGNLVASVCCDSTEHPAEGGGQCCNSTTDITCQGYNGGGDASSGDLVEWCCPDYLGCSTELGKCGDVTPQCPNEYTYVCGTTCCPYGLQCDEPNSLCYFMCQNGTRLNFP